MHRFILSFYLGSILCFATATAMAMPADESRNSISQQKVGSLTTAERTIVHSCLNIVKLAERAPGYDRGDHSFARLMGLGPTLDEEDERHAQAEFDEFPQSKEFKHFTGARRYSVIDMIFKGTMHRNEGDFSEAYNWLLLAFGCRFSQNNGQIGPHDLAWRSLTDLRKQIVDQQIPTQSKRGKRLRLPAAEQNRQMGMSRIKQSIDNFLKIVSKNPSGSVHDLISGLAYVVGNHCPQFKDEIITFIVLSAKPEHLRHIATLFRNRHIDPTTGRADPIDAEREQLLFQHEMWCLRKLNEGNIYHLLGGRYYQSVTDPKILDAAPSFNRLVSREEFAERAAYYLSYSDTLGAMATLGALFFKKLIAPQLDLTDRFRYADLFFTKANHTAVACEMGREYLLAAERSIFGAGPSLDEKTTAEYLEKAKDYIERYLEGVQLPTQEEIELDLGLAYDYSGETDKAIKLYNLIGSAKTLHNLGGLYCRVASDNPAELLENLQRAKDAFKLSYTKDNTLSVALYAQYQVILKQCANSSSSLKRAMHAREAITCFRNILDTPAVEFLKAKDFLYVSNFFLEWGEYDDALWTAKIALSRGDERAQFILDILENILSDNATASLSGSDDEEEVLTDDSKGEDIESEESPEGSAPDTSSAVKADEKDEVLKRGVTTAASPSSSDIPNDSATDISPAVKADGNDEVLEGGVTTAASSSSSEVPMSRREKKLERKRQAFQRKLESELKDAKFIDPLRNAKTNVEWNLNYFECDVPSASCSKVEELIADILRQPWGLSGSGQPEILKNSHKEYGMAVYSRRITHADRLVYALDSKSNTIHVLSTQGHYEKLGKIVQKFKMDKGRGLGT